MDKTYLFVVIISVDFLKVSSDIHFVNLKARHRLDFALDTAENARKAHVEDTAARSR
jgi:hypothetical protein